MARPVLNLKQAVIAAACAICAVSAGCKQMGTVGAGEVVCQAPRGNIPKEMLEASRAVDKWLNASPLVQYMRGRFGNPRSCDTVVDDDNITKILQFAGGGVRARVTPAIEYAEIKLRLDRDSIENAVAQLKAEERGMFTPDGCGLRWDEPNAEERTEKKAPDKARVTRIIRYYGDSCNCGAEVEYEGDRVIGVSLHGAC